MPRVKEFDETEVLDQALELFRARGYMHTSFEDLTKSLGVSRQSLYDTYGDKQTLYHTALKRYLARATDKLRHGLENPAPVREVLRGLFEAIVADGGCSVSHGCPMVNSMVEQAPHDAEARALAQAHARAVEGLFASRLSLAQRAGEIGPEKDPVLLGRYFYHTLLGLSVSMRALGDRAGLREIVRLALRALD